MCNFAIYPLEFYNKPTVDVFDDVSSICAKFDRSAISTATNLVTTEELALIFSPRHHHPSSGGAQKSLQTICRKVHYLLSSNSYERCVNSHLPFFKCNSKSSVLSILTGLMSITSCVHSHLFVTVKCPVSIVIIP